MKEKDKQKLPTYQLVIFVLLVFSVILLAFRQWSIQTQFREAEKQLAVAQQSSLAHWENLQRVVAHVEAIFHHSFRANSRQDGTLSEEDLATLQTVARYYQEFLKHNRRNEDYTLLCARASLLLGRIYSQQSHVELAMRAFDEASGILTTISTQSPNPEISFAIAENKLYMSHLHVALGETKEARRLSSIARSGLEMLADKYPGEAKYQSVLVEALINLGVIDLTSEDDSAAPPSLQDAVDILRQLSKASPDENDYLARLIDAEQLLAGYFARKGEFTDAEKACRRSLHTLTSLRSKIGDQRTTTLNIAGELARANLKRLEKHSNVSSPDEIADWAWKSLLPSNGKRIRTGSLVKGKLAAEFETHDALLLSYATQDSWWRRILVQIVEKTHRNIQAAILVPDEHAKSQLTEEFRKLDIPADRVKFIHITTDRIWMRDFGPAVVSTDADSFRFVDARYSHDRFHDDSLPSRLGLLTRTPIMSSLVAIDGGNLLTNGDGVCIATDYLLKRNAEVGFTKEQVTRTIKRLFGATQVVYVEPLDGEGNGHVDWFATFTSPDTIVVGDYRGSDPANTKLLDRNAEKLSKVKTSNGPLKVVRIPMPPREKEFFGGTYTNVVYANGVLLVPTWNSASKETEEEVLSTFRRLLPEWKVFGIDSSDMISQEGSLRCATMQLHRIDLSFN